MTNEVRFKLSPPWVLYVKKLEAMFDGDPLIAFNVDFNSEEGPSVTLATNDGDKAAALVKVLPEEKKFGNVTLKINVDCPHMSNRAFARTKELFEVLFKNNPVFAYAVSPADDNVWYPDVTYVCYKQRVVQFFADNLNDCHGIISTLYQDIAAEIFEDAGLDGVYYNTDVEVGKLGKPTGQWP